MSDNLVLHNAKVSNPADSGVPKAKDSRSPEASEKSEIAGFGRPSCSAFGYINYSGQPIIQSDTAAQIDYPTLNRHKFLFKILRWILKRAGKSHRRSHLLQT